MHIYIVTILLSLAIHQNYASAPAADNSYSEQIESLKNKYAQLSQECQDEKNKIEHFLNSRYQKKIDSNPGLFNDQKTIQVKGISYPLMPSNISSTYHPIMLKHYLSIDLKHVEATALKDHTTLLMNAMQQSECVQTQINHLIFQHNPEVNRKGKYGRTALYFAIRSSAASSLPAVQELLARGADAQATFTQKAKQVQVLGIDLGQEITVIQHPTILDLANDCAQHPEAYPSDCIDGYYYEKKLTDLRQAKLKLIEDHITKKESCGQK
ncbi:MAG: ankyrin repeat domain-containing protein [Candidatus Babeliales bacterium]|nr:ankyrin repeat domain-containing protein [Candidatus Babeliales bacterium]